jgi:acyl-coenzyme A synthetase/AMP-(fatty) acid ligase
MLGYWGDEDRSQETIRGAWLRTGDVAHLDHEGFLFLHGRSDDIIKSAGERISALEIEAALEQHPGVVEAAVIAAPHPVLGEAPLAWIVPRSQLSPPTPGELMGHCARLLTPHKIPREFRVASELPKTASGKVQKNRLRAGEVTR